MKGRTELAKDGAVSVAEAARFLGVGRTTVYELIGAGKLAAAKVGGRRVVLRAALVRLLAEATPAG